ncbi:MAG: hypothetical protein KAI66_27935 [Lentisphaeria bacterium]|nr:hypothetical protein [Lentisphaeria bacterium]
MIDVRQNTGLGSHQRTRLAILLMLFFALFSFSCASDTTDGDCDYDTDCSGTLQCVDGRCVELTCADVSCPEGEVCFEGDCYLEDCDWRTCPGLGEVGVEEDCRQSSCIGVECPSGERCANGHCYPVDCETKPCPGYGEVCVEEECLQRSCVDVQCPAGETCASGYCYPSDCTDMNCSGEGEVCVDGVCERLACLNVECEPGHTCIDGWCYPCEDCGEAFSACLSSCVWTETVPTCTASGCEDVVTEHNAPSGTICVGRGTLADVSITNYCAMGLDCEAGACQGSIWYAGCDGLGGCRPAHDHTDGHEQIVYADVGQTLNATCDTDGVEDCGVGNWACVADNTCARIGSAMRCGAEHICDQILPETTENCPAATSCSAGVCVVDTLCLDMNHCAGDSYFGGRTCDGNGACALDYQEIGCCGNSRCSEPEYCRASEHFCLSGASVGRNCRDILLAGQSTGDGLYMIDPDGDGNATTQVYCNMTDGGWTRLNGQVANSTVSFGAGDVISANNNPGTPDCLPPYGETFQVDDIIVPHDAMRLIFDRTTSVVQCARMAGLHLFFDGYHSAYWNGSGWTNHDTCCWSCPPWANANEPDASTNMTGLVLTWKFETPISHFPNTSFSFDSTCSTEADTGMIHATAWIK